MSKETSGGYESPNKLQTEKKEGSKEDEEKEEEDDEDEDDDDDEDDEDEDYESAEPLSERAKNDTEESTRLAETLAGRIRVEPIVDLDGETPKESIGKSRPWPLLSFFGYDLLRTVERVPDHLKKVGYKISSFFTAMENWGHKQLEKNAGWIKYIPFVGSWLLGPVEKSWEETDKKKIEEREKLEKATKDQAKKDAEKVKRELKEAEKKLEAQTKNANAEFAARKNKREEAEAKKKAEKEKGEENKTEIIERKKGGVVRGVAEIAAEVAIAKLISQKREARESSQEELLKEE